MALVFYLAVGHQALPAHAAEQGDTVLQVAAVVLVLVSGLWPDLAPIAETLIYAVAGLHPRSPASTTLRRYSRSDAAKGTVAT